MTRAEVPRGPDLPRFATPAGVAASPAADLVPPAPSGEAQVPAGLVPADERAHQARMGAASPAAPRSVARGSRLLAVLELIAGVAVFALGLQVDNSVLHGNADTVSLVLHGFALYGIGSGLYGVRP
jgi:hypothetical protein